MRFENLASDGPLKPGGMVYVIDDDSDLRRSLHFLLETRGIFVSLFASGIQFLGELNDLKPAPIILDLRMPQMDGLQVVSELSSRLIHWPVIMLSGHGNIATAVQTLQTGAIDFLEKPVSTSDLLKSINTAFERLASQSITESRRDEAAERVALLTPREVEVLEHLCKGCSNKQVAFELSISPRTVEMHRANAFRQLQVRSLVEAACVRTAAGG